MTILAVALAGSIALIAMAGRDTKSFAAPAPVDFSGRWKLVEQETKASRGKGKTGNHEEPVVIVQTADRLVVKVESADPAGQFEYDLSGRRGETASRWDGSALVTTGKRLFTTPGGPEKRKFTERRTLSRDGKRMTVETRIDFFLEDLYRTSVFEHTR